MLAQIELIYKLNSFRLYIDIDIIEGGLRSYTKKMNVQEFKIYYYV